MGIKPNTSRLESTRHIIEQGYPLKKYCKKYISNDNNYCQITSRYFLHHATPRSFFNFKEWLNYYGIWIQEGNKEKRNKIIPEKIP